MRESTTAWPRPVRLAALTSALLASGLALTGCSSEPEADGPAEVLAQYQDARNAGDVNALISLYAEDAVVTDHPLDTDSPAVATGVEEIRDLEITVPSLQRPEDATEYSDVEVSGDQATFIQRFINSAGECFSTAGNQITVEGGTITTYDWGDEPAADVCP